ncbi:MAG TPA: OmpA family protein [Burkholderiaceae bacterium]
MTLRSVFKLLFAALLATLAVAAYAADPDDLENAKDHPEVPRFPGFYISDMRVNDFNEFVFGVKGFDAGRDGKGEKRAGRYTELHYGIKDGAREPSAVELIRNYENAIKKAGGKMVYREQVSGSDGAVFRVPLRNNGERWIQLEYGGAGSRYLLYIIDVEAMQQKLEFSASDMATALGKDGFIALNGILFDTGKATLKDESTAQLDEVATLLKNDAKLKLAIEGHTDNVGDKKANLALSKQRAAAIVTYLTGKGVAGARLQSEGKGDTAPVADNRTEDGRAKNRRVELRKL